MKLVNYTIRIKKGIPYIDDFKKWKIDGYKFELYYG